MRRKFLVGACSIATLTVAWSVPLTAHATRPSTAVACGQTLTSSIRLANNLSGCTGDGLVIGADNITVDLGGHSVTGVNAPGSDGISDDGHRGVRIENGTIATFFHNGVALRGAPHSAVSNLAIRKIGAGGGDTDTSAGVLVKDSPHTLVIANRVRNDVTAFQSDGVDVLSSADSTIVGNRLAENIWDGMVVIDSPHARVIANAFDGNQNQGIEVNGGSDGALLAGNLARNNVSNGLVVGAISGARIEANHLAGNAESGLFMFDLHNSRVSANRAGGNGTGIDLEGGQFGSTGNRIANNNTSGNTSTGLVAGDGADDNVIVANVSDANQGAPDTGGGIILIGVRGNTVRGNVANGNRDVGIGVFDDQPGDTTGNVLRANTADLNRNHGMSVVEGTIDGGRNMAHRNIPLPNCLGVSCT